MLPPEAEGNEGSREICFRVEESSASVAEMLAFSVSIDVARSRGFESFQDGREEVCPSLWRPGGCLRMWSSSPDSLGEGSSEISLLEEG